MIEEEIPLYPVLPRHASLLEAGNTYLIDKDISSLVELKHCSGLNCEGPGFLGSVQELAKNAIISSDNYDSRPFTPPIGTTLTVVSKLHQSDRCDSCIQTGGVCVTLGPHDSSEIYTLEYLFPKYMSWFVDVPIGSVVRLTENGNGYSLKASGVNFNKGINYLVVNSNGTKTLQRHKIGGGNSDITLEPKPDSIVEIREIPVEANIWATCWELKGPSERDSKIRTALNTVVGKLLHGR